MELALSACCSFLFSMGGLGPLNRRSFKGGAAYLIPRNWLI